jgi:hypothetical protein
MLREHVDLKAYLFVFRKRSRLMKAVTNIHVSGIAIFLAVTKYRFS